MIPFFQKNRALIDLEWTQKYGKIYAFHGALANRTTLMITDVELVKQVTTKDFAHFINRSYIPAYHELWNENMLNAEAAQWKKLRSLISPTFSSAKLRGMNKLMTHCIDKLTVYLDSVVAEGDTITDTKKVIGGFTIDVIASTSFGTETNANGDRSIKNPIIEHGKNFFNVKPLRYAQNRLYCMFPESFFQSHNCVHFSSMDAQHSRYSDVLWRGTTWVLWQLDTRNAETAEREQGETKWFYSVTSRFGSGWAADK